MNFAVPHTTSDRFGLTLELLCRAVAARIARGVQAAVILVVWTRIRRIERQVQGLLARFQAGRLVVRTGSPAVRPAVAGAKIGSGESKAAVRTGLPRRFGWLLELVPHEAANFSSQLRAVLAEPEMVALLEASPQAVRVLRPLCWMLRLEPAVLGRRGVRAAKVPPLGEELALDPHVSSRSEDRPKAEPPLRSGRFASLDPVLRSGRRGDIERRARCADP